MPVEGDGTGWHNTSAGGWGFIPLAFQSYNSEHSGLPTPSVNPFLYLPTPDSVHRQGICRDNHGNCDHWQSSSRRCAWPSGSAQGHVRRNRSHGRLRGPFCSDKLRGRDNLKRGFRSYSMGGA